MRKAFPEEARGSRDSVPSLAFPEQSQGGNYEMWGVSDGINGILA